MRKQTLKKGLAAILGLDALCADAVSAQCPAAFRIRAGTVCYHQRVQLKCPERGGNLLFLGWKTGKRNGGYRGGRKDCL